MALRISLLAVSRRSPRWVDDGFDEYARRLRHPVELDFRRIAPARGGAAGGVADEGRRLLAALPERAHVVALDERGAAWTTAQLARELERWIAATAPVALLIGGADGLAEACGARADARWSLSPLTLPHGLARIVVVEALYRAQSLLDGHPYHRA